MLPFTPHPAGPSFSASAESHFNPSQLVSESDYVQEDAVEDRKLAHPRASPVPSSARHTRFEGLANFYYTLSYTLGFKEKYSLSLFIVLGGALVCYCFARTLMMNPDNVRDKTIPGKACSEWFWYRQDLYKPCIMLHIYLSIISGIFVVFQFLPAIRRRSMILHRINGYMSLILLVPSTITGSIVARRAYGGELNSQSAFWTIGIMTIFSAAVGILNVKKTRVHRKWMLRTVAFAAAPITGRIISIMARYIVTQMGIYHAVGVDFPCYNHAGY
ncbi:hypothetical protein FIBSPDRAFT_731068 [Athelia psychrophila]|uniref:DUF2306 domain-containing protein n=1 Tax=Athelia psychrophila TaxID=1759441 RepID=A0A166QR96_9AGAM|nr:hypothetical protein FIBSPDRAFT_731068 [Fibularhizoctonia sp. CBS 109695]